MRQLLPALAILFLMPLSLKAQTEPLTGRIIGSTYSVDYTTGNPSTTINTKESVFDDNLSTFFASYDRSYTWVGLDLGEKHVITKIAYAPRNGSAARMQLGVFEGANSPDFTDAVPIYMIKDVPQEGKLTTKYPRVTKGFRYVRYVGPNNVRCNVAELKFYGKKGEGNDNRFYSATNLPLVVIHTDSAKEITSKTIYTPGIIHVISDEGSSIFTDSLDIRGRGNGSWIFPKKPYKLKLAHKARLLGMPAKAKKWTLINNYGDKTLVRNLLAFRISEIMGMEYTPAGRMVDVMFNGEYKGTYQLCDQIEVRKNRVGITEMAPVDIAEPNLSGGYLLEVDAYADQEKSHFTTSSSAYSLPVTIKSPDEDDIVPQQFNYIKDYFGKMATRLAGNLYLNAKYGYRNFLDPESFLKHFLVGELSGNTDTYWSVYMYKDRDSTRFRTGPVWDFDLAFENDSRTHPISDINTFLYASSKSSCAGNMRGFVGRVIGAERKLLQTIWSKARYDRGLDLDNLNLIIDSLENELKESQNLNFIRWPIMNQIVHQEYQCAGSFENEVQVIRDYLSYRMPWMDKMVGLTPVGIDDNKVSEGSITPVDGGMRISGFAREAEITVYDVSGMTVARTIVSRSETTINLAPGVYIVKAVSDGVTLKNKIVVR